MCILVDIRCTYDHVTQIFGDYISGQFGQLQHELEDYSFHEVEGEQGGYFERGKSVLTQQLVASRHSPMIAFVIHIQYLQISHVQK